MLRRRLELPLGRDTTSRVLPWIIALMVYLAAIALIGTIVLHGLAGRWQAGLSGSLTVQIPPPEDPAGGAGSGNDVLARALEVLRATAGVQAASALDSAAINDLLAPWLGAESRAIELPLPDLIDVTVAPGSPPDLADLRRRLQAVAPGAIVEDHAHWRRQVVALARSIEIAAVVVVGLIGLAAVLVVIFATQAGLAAHREIIEVMHLVGARDDFIARQFQAHMVERGLVGGVGGVALAVITIVVLGWAAQGVDAALLPNFSVDFGTLAVFILLPIAAALIAMLTARQTVLRVLGRLL